jgi:taurine--2-oxoglutarate transaminase
MAARHELIGEVRGLGVFWAIELVADRATREPVSAATMGRIKAAMLERGVMPFLADNRIHVVPPCVITAEEARQGLAVIDEVLTLVEQA